MDAVPVYFTKQAAPARMTKVAALNGGCFWWMALTGKLTTQEQFRATLAELGHHIPTPSEA